MQLHIDRLQHYLNHSNKQWLAHPNPAQQRVLAALQLPLTATKQQIRTAIYNNGKGSMVRHAYLTAMRIRS